MTIDNNVVHLTPSEIDREKILLSIDASIQAYQAFDKDDPARCNRENVTPPPGYELVDSWTGVDAVFNCLKRVECYGIILRSQVEPYTYIFAFRGTDSIEDLCDDFACNYTSFTAYEPSAIIPAKVRVESGFYRIYTDADKHNDDTASMQHQLFALVDKYQASAKPIHKLYVTGHSLGCTLCTMFALDLALSRPEIQVINYNFASPQVGNQEFVDFYQQQIAQQDVETRTVRVQNIYDRIPHTPLAIQGYKHLPYVYLIAFFRDDLIGKLDIIDNHSVHNYQKVLKCSFNSVEEFCEITFESDRNKNIKSVRPDPSLIGSNFMISRK